MRQKDNNNIEQIKEITFQQTKFYSQSQGTKNYSSLRQRQKNLSSKSPLRLKKIKEVIKDEK